MRRAGAGKTCPGVDIVNCNKVPFSQDRFLLNMKNKSGFIKQLASKLEEDAHTVKICKGDADASIEKQAELGATYVVAVADDTDIAMMLLYHWREYHGSVVFFQERENRGWMIGYACKQCEIFREHILFVHAFSGCDTISAPFVREKISFLTAAKTNKMLQDVSDTMNDVWATKEEIEEASIKVFKIIYSGNDRATLCKLR